MGLWVHPQELFNFQRDLLISTMVTCGHPETDYHIAHIFILIHVPLNSQPMSQAPQTLFV